MKTNKELHQEFLELGINRRKLTNELLALLPEIFDRKIYLKYASTIIEYAGKFGGLSKGVVTKRLRLEKYLRDKPFLREAIKTEGVHKVALVANIATTETEEAWVDKLKNMSKNAIQELSKEVRNKEMAAKNENFCEDGLFGGSRGQMPKTSTFCKATPLKITIELTDESAFLFLKFKKELERASKKDSGVMRILSNKEAMNEILKRQVDAEFPKKVILEDSFYEGKFIEKQKNIEVKRENAPEKIGDHQQKISRYIPVYIKEMATLSTQGKCAYPNCGHPAEIFHHRERFAESKKRLDSQKNIHQSIIHLCKTHHEFAHNGIIANERQNIEQWELKVESINLSDQDLLYREIRQSKT